ncbi:MAG: peptidase C11, partial [Clostridia bacterium]|nr:peptidase C11 [Clostridia bacterium]
ATLETALVCNDYADYMIASEESEPGTGWYCTDWLTQLSKNTSASTESIGKTIVDTFVAASQRAQANAQVTLSVLDLAKMQGTVPAALRNFSTATTSLIKGDGYRKVAEARANVRQFARQSRINQVDMIDLCDRIGTAESKTLASALKGCVAYNKTTISRAYGVSIYFPYESLNGVKSAVNTYNSLGIDAEYAKCIQSFASLEQGGQFASSASQQPYGSYSSGGDLLSTLLGGLMDSGAYGSSGGSSYGSSPYGSSSPLGSLLGQYTTGSGSGSYSAGNSVDASTIMDLLSAFSGRSMPAALDWLDTDLVASKAADIAQNHLDPARITITDKNGQKTLVLTDEEWAFIETAAMNLFVDDGQGYIDLGYDNYLTFDQDNDLVLGFDGTWLCLNGHPVAFYMTEAGEEGTFGRIPARITRKVDGQSEELLVNIMIFLDQEGNVALLGADPLYAGETETQGKGSIPLESGDKVQLLCDYYTYEGAYEGSYTLSDAFTLGSDPVIEYLTLANADISVSYRLTDIYGNVYWTPAYLY